MQLCMSMSTTDGESSGRDPVFTLRLDRNRKAQVVQTLDYGDSMADFIREAIDEKLAREGERVDLSDERVREILDE
jgi:hypothetical protein